jgi:two-component system phosphate regulon sensor histidine kinase PhoR
MKRNGTTIFILISSLALFTVLLIQVNWIFQSAKVKEDLFNEKANIILARTTEALLADTTTCKNIESGKNERHKIDSLFQHYMNFYNFHIPYSFEVMKPNALRIKNINDLNTKFYPNPVGCYDQSLHEVTHKNGIELKLNFPKKDEFIMAEMGPLFITSIILIIIVIILFWRTTLSLKMEKQISEHTTDFLNNMTHEFKTPLTNIALASKMIMKDPGNKEDKTKYYSEIILAENEKLRLQVEQVLSMTALERGEIPVQKTELDLHQLIMNAAKSMNLQIENKQGSIHLNLSAENFVIMGDRTHLTNAVCNLIDNAIKYSTEKPEISIQTSNINHNLVLVITDKGIGIEQKYQEKVFDKFFRVPTGDVHNAKGFGLGLAYIKKIVELHQGTITLKSDKEIGTTFTITLPNA